MSIKIHGEVCFFLTILTKTHFLCFIILVGIVYHGEAQANLHYRELNTEQLVPYLSIDQSNLWYTDYNDDEIPKDHFGLEADSPDYFRASDLCFKESYSRMNCPSEMDCSHLNDSRLGPAKLCINRAPTEDGRWYVLLQKCIPQWENCDKCLCGKMSSNSIDGVCWWAPGCDPDDDRISIDCGNPRKVTVLGTTFDSTYTANLVSSVDNIPSASPTVSPAPRYYLR